jgi:SAM-dependent methyltransferase
MARRYLEALAEDSFKLNRLNILGLVEQKPHPRLCDLGCDDGVWTMELARAARAEQIHGVELVRDRAALAHARGVTVAIADLNRQLPYSDEIFDIVHANQVIEHVSDLDGFLTEIHRILRPAGVSVISTENGSSWHNIGASVLGWQTFSLSNISPRVGGLGNPLALHRGEAGLAKTWTHKTILNYRGLLELHEVYGLHPIAVRGAGYYPLPAITASVDPRPFADGHGGEALIQRQGHHPISDPHRTRRSTRSRAPSRHGRDSCTIRTS